MKACAPVPLPERWCRANSPMKARLLNGQSFRYTARLFKLGITIGGRRAAEDQDIRNPDGLLMLATAILQKGHRVMTFQDFELLCMSNDLEAEDVLSKCEFLEREDSGIVDIVEICLDDALVFCLVEKYGSDGDSNHVQIHELGTYANELLPKRERETKGLRQILALNADKFCVSGSTVTIRQRPTWPEPSIDDAVPTSLSQLSDGVEREESTDSSTVKADTFAGRLRKSVPDITEALLKQPVLFKGSLGKTSAASDTTKLASAFEKCVEQYGILMHGSR
ncbi:hypothetical protein AK812_SmicGene39801 [Symbiodinium microadriaticum]|uniref:Uncharacterized protein n=1 Tax=Symbiodinium microadriaticum TaxID=2951 RepID=A0A1Q9CAJ6_SYMMI|nr:hypothetical protein AK812_SmicGene39801 [Symbiodinium microadriaticum]